MFNFFAKGGLEGLAKLLLVQAHPCFIDVARIALVNVMGFDGGQLVGA